MAQETKKGTPKDVFLHLLAVVTLYVSVVAFIALWWQYINVLFPDPLLCGSGSCVYDPIRLAMAALIVVFPVHILIAWLIGREFRADPEKREIRVRKWLWYITLFIAAVTIIVDLVVLINNFLRGDLTIQFSLKILVVLAAAAAVFGYYLWDLKRRAKPSSKPKLFAWITSVIILASIIYGFFLIGMPSTQRARRFDEQRVSHLQQIQSEVINYWIQKNKLPANLDSLKDPISGFVPPKDPETGVQYEYVAESPLAFKLCAVFEMPDTYSGDDGARLNKAALPAGNYLYQQNWDHDKGRTCFERVIDPQLYKNRTVPVPRGD